MADKRLPHSPTFTKRRGTWTTGPKAPPPTQRVIPLAPWLTVPQPQYYPKLGVWLIPTVETSKARFERAVEALDKAHMFESQRGPLHTCKCRALKDGFLVCWNCRTR